MAAHKAFSPILTLTLLPIVSPEPIRASRAPSREPGLPGALENTPGATDNWWAAVQEDIRRSEYHVTWQERTSLTDVQAAYQAHNRAHNLRTYFAPSGIRVIPRVFEGEALPWELGLTLSGYGYEDIVRPVTAATQHVEANRITYERDALTEWYVNDERGLEQGFALAAPPAGAQSGDSLTLDLALNGDLTPMLADDGQMVEFGAVGEHILRYGGLVVYDATGRQLPAGLSVLGDSIRITYGDTADLYPITVGMLVTGLSPTHDWSAEGDQDLAQFGHSVGTAGDVNGDGYADVIVGAFYYDNGESNEGRAWVYHGSATGLSTIADWDVESDQVDACLGYAVGTVGDVNGDGFSDGFSDVIVGAYYYDNGQTNEGVAFVYHGSGAGLSSTPDWTGEADQGSARFGAAVGTAGDVNGDGYADVIVGADLYDNGQTNEGGAFVYYGNGGDGLHLLPRQLPTSDATPIAHLGISDSWTSFQISLIGRSPAGREDVRLQWQVAPLGTPFTATNVISGTSGWTDVLTTGVTISLTVDGLEPGTPYHWRVRMLYRPGNAMGQPSGRWIHIPWNGWTETDLRTAPGYDVYLPLVLR